MGAFQWSKSYHPYRMYSSHADVMHNKLDLLRGGGLFKWLCYSPLPF